MNDERSAYREAMEGLRFSDEAKKRMACSLATGSESANEARPHTPVRVVQGRKRWRVVAAIAAAAVLVLVVGGGAYATGALMSMANVFDDVFGGPPAKTEVVDKIGRPVGASVSSGGVTVKAEAIIGDRANYVVVFSVSKDDGTAFDVPEASDNGCFPLGFGGPSMVRVDGTNGGGGSAYFYDADPTDNALQYVQKLSVGTFDGTVIGKTARVDLRDLMMYGDGEPRLIAEGAWKMKFVMNYEDTSIDVAAGQSFDLNGMRATVDSIALSPIAVTVEYTVEGTIRYEEQESGRMSERNVVETERFEVPIMLTLVDGTTIDASNGASASRVDGELTRCRKATIFDGFVDVDEVVSIKIGDATVPVP